MAYVVRITVPGVARPMFSEPMQLADARLAEKTLKRRQGFGVTIKHVPPRPRAPRIEHDPDDTLEARLERVAAARRASRRCTCAEDECVVCDCGCGCDCDVAAARRTRCA